jgi:hypothetical protein
MNINEKLTVIQTEFKSKKTRFNSFGKYYFRSAEDILEATKPFLKKLGVSVTIHETLISTEEGPVLQVTATLSDSEKLDHFMSAQAIVGVDLNQKGMQRPQQFGAASSYGKKYALGNLFLIDDTQDSDATNNHGKSEHVRLGSTQQERKAGIKQKLTNDSLNKAKDYVAKGGSIETIKNKYIISAKQEKLLTQTL